MKLYDKQGKEVLSIDPSKEINRGGEGAIFVHPTDSSKVVKVYHTNGTLSEVALSELMQLPNNFIKPLELFYDKTKKIKGLSMQYLDTHKLDLLAHIVNKQSALKKGYIDNVKEHVYANMVNCIMHAHKAGIVIGDLNPYNIFVSPKGDIYFIDVDSYQTKSKPHSGVLLPEIRDWLQQNIDIKSDYFAMSVLVFQVFTHVHPYKGVHAKIKTLEERMIKQVSVLSGDKDLILPSFYEPFPKGNLSDQFVDIFQRAKRFLPMLSGNIQKHVSVLTPQAPIVKSIVEGALAIKVIDISVEDFNCSSNFFYTRKGIVYTIYECKTHGVTGRLSDIQADDVFLGDKNILYSEYSKLHELYSQKVMTNFVVPINSFTHFNGGNVVYFDEDTDTYSILKVDEIFNGNSVNYHKGVIFTKSVQVQTGIVQSILGLRWILNISNGLLQTLRTNMNVHDVYMTPSGQFGSVAIKGTTGVDYHLLQLDGMKVQIGPLLNSMPIFAEKGDYLYLPGAGSLEVYRQLDLVKIASIACRFVNEQSVIRSCSAGLLCLTGDTLYLLTKT